MIKQTITVEYVISKETGKMGFDLSELATADTPGYMVDYSDRKRTFTSFKNDGTISKSQRKFETGTKLSVEDQERIFEKAESEMRQQIAVKADTEKDMQRAMELAVIINCADFNGEMVTIKTKNSHSKWYQHGGEGHMVSFYHTQVPVAVEAEARELQDIRRKHQNNDLFDFNATAYKVIEVREADHDNYKEEY